jgi:hypothetical protein
LERSGQRAEEALASARGTARHAADSTSTSATSDGAAPCSGRAANDCSHTRAMNIAPASASHSRACLQQQQPGFRVHGAEAHAHAACMHAERSGSRLEHRAHCSNASCRGPVMDAHGCWVAEAAMSSARRSKETVANARESQAAISCNSSSPSPGCLARIASMCSASSSTDTCSVAMHCALRRTLACIVRAAPSPTTRHSPTQCAHAAAAAELALGHGGAVAEAAQGARGAAACSG